MSIHLNHYTNAITCDAIPLNMPQQLIKGKVYIRTSFLDADVLTIPADTSVAIVTSTASSTVNTFSFPTATDGQILWFLTRQQLTGLSWPSTVVGGPSGMAQGQGIMFVYSSTDSKWYCLN